MADTAEYWDHNVRYQPLILAAVPPGCQAALDDRRHLLWRYSLLWTKPS
jgi:hypothetical protein